MSEKISIYTMGHKPFSLPKYVDKDIFKSVLCGSSLFNANEYNFDITLPEFKDNIGDNISDKNRHYSELTGIYWVWKNDKDSDIIGINHYRRYFLDNNEEGFIDRETILSNLEKYDFMVLGPGSDQKIWYNENFSVYKGYAGDHNVRDIDNALAACKKLFPDIYEAFNKEVRTSTALCMCNLMICRKELFDKYCSFLFPILFEVEKQIDFNDEFYDDYQQRALGFLSERLMRPWLVINNYKFKDQKICSFGG